MKKKTLMLFAGLVLFLPSMSASASSPAMPRVIDHFVVNLFPKARHYFWVVNAAQKATQREMIVDLNTFTPQKEGESPVESRFLLLILDGEVFAAQNIPLNATVDCGKGEAV